MHKKLFKSWQIFIVAGTVVLTLFITLLCIGFMVNYEVHTDVLDTEAIRYWNDNLPREQHKWYELGIEELRIAFQLQAQRNQARNVQIFLVNGVDAAALAAARFSNNNMDSQKMSWDKFTHLGRLKNSCANSMQFCDTFQRGTALFGGVKTKRGLGGVDSAVEFRNCTAALNTQHQIKSIFRQAQDLGLRTGLVTTGRVTAPTIAALYAHTADTSWECDAVMPSNSVCQDTAKQLVFGETGKKLNVIMGGGRQTLVSNVPIKANDPLDNNACDSKDERNLIRDWQYQKLLAKEKYAVLLNTEELLSVNTSRVDYVLGIFANANLNDDNERMPDMQLMLEKSLNILQRTQSGYLMLMEYEARFFNDIAKQAQELRQLNKVLEAVLTSSSATLENTLSLVVFSNGRYKRTAVDASAEMEINTDQHIEQSYNHIVSDTLIYARGPQSFLFHGVHEEVYMAHVISYALKMGEFAPKKDVKSKQKNS